MISIQVCPSVGYDKATATQNIITPQLPPFAILSVVAPQINDDIFITLLTRLYTVSMFPTPAFTKQAFIHTSLFMTDSTNTLSSIYFSDSSYSAFRKYSDPFPGERKPKHFCSIEGPQEHSGLHHS